MASGALSRLMVLACSLALCAGAAAHALPTNPAVTQETIGSTICQPRWAKSVRPSTKYTNQFKRAAMRAAGVPWARAAEFELDHRLPISLGGAPRDPGNLMLQSWKRSAHAYDGETDAVLKDKLEKRLQVLVCTEQLPLEDAQRCIWEDWRACVRRHVGAGK